MHIRLSPVVLAWKFYHSLLGSYHDISKIATSMYKQICDGISINMWLYTALLQDIILIYVPCYLHNYWILLFLTPAFVIFSLIFSWFFLLIVAIAFWIFRMLSIISFRDFLVYDNAKTTNSAWNLFYSSAAYTSRAKWMLLFTINSLPIWRVTYFRAWRFMRRFRCCWDFSELGFARIPVSFC